MGFIQMTEAVWTQLGLSPHTNDQGSTQAAEDIRHSAGTQWCSLGFKGQEHSQCSLAFGAGSQGSYKEKEVQNELKEQQAYAPVCITVWYKM